MAQYWFKPKRYGYGNFPVTWQGWLATLCLVALIMVSFYSDIPMAGRKAVASLKEWLRFGLDATILTTLFIVLFNEKTEGGIRWRWGKDKK